MTFLLFDDCLFLPFWSITVSPKCLHCSLVPWDCKFEVRCDNLLYVYVYWIVLWHWTVLWNWPSFEGQSDFSLPIDCCFLALLQLFVLNLLNGPKRKKYVLKSFVLLNNQCKVGQLDVSRSNKLERKNNNHQNWNY